MKDFHQADGEVQGQQVVGIDPDQIGPGQALGEVGGCPRAAPARVPGERAGAESPPGEDPEQPAQGLGEDVVLRHRALREEQLGELDADAEG